jgi:hypothetical protein
MSYTKFKDGYEIETTPGTSIIDGVGDTAYLLGAIHEKSTHPSPIPVIRYTPTGYNVKEVSAGLMWKAQMSMRGTMHMIMQNGLPIYLALGDSSTVGNVHTLVPFTDGSPIPSFTLNHEQEGSATDEEYQFLGCKVGTLAMSYDMEETPFLSARMEYMCMKAQDGIALTTAPALPATANTNAYTELERIWDVGGTPVNIDGLQSVEISIGNGLVPRYGHTYDAGTYTGMWPFMITEAQRKQYKVEMMLHPNTIERRMWDSLISTTTAITATFKFIRSATDYIKFTVVGPVVEHELVTPSADELLLEKVVIEPYTMSVDVEDAIADARYGD